MDKRTPAITQALLEGRSWFYRAWERVVLQRVPFGPLLTRDQITQRVLNQSY